MRKLKIIFILSIFLFLVMGTASAIEDNSTDTVQADFEDEPLSLGNSTDTLQVDIADEPLSLGNSSYELSSSNNDNLTSVSEAKLGTFASGDAGSAVQKSSKSSLDVITFSNFVNKGDKYEMYLRDVDKNFIAGKKLTININGKDYKVTTESGGKFSVKINSAKAVVSLKISYKGDSKYNSFSQVIKLKNDGISIEIGNSKLLTNGYLRIYVHGPLKKIANRYIKVKVGNKLFIKKTDAEGNLIFKPKVGAKKHWIEVIFKGHKISKKIRCIKGNVINPFKWRVPTYKGVPDVDRMPKNFVMGYDKAQYVLKRANYFEVMDRDSYSLFMYGKLSKYTLFKTKLSPKVYHVIKREKWNVIEREIFTKVVKRNKYDYWPKTITVDLEGRSYTYSEVRDIQNTGYTCGPTSASVCTQVLKNFHSEKYFQLEAGVTNGINIPDLKRVLEKNKCSAYYFYGGSSFDNAIKQLKKGSALIAYLPNHYVAVIDVSPDGKKVLVSNSYGSYNGGSKGIPTNWVSVKKLKSTFAGVGLVVKPKYDLSKSVKREVKKTFLSMGGEWKRQNVNERIPNIGL